MPDDPTSVDTDYAARTAQSDDAATGRALLAAHPELMAQIRPAPDVGPAPATYGLSPGDPRVKAEAAQQNAAQDAAQGTTPAGRAEAGSGAITGLDEGKLAQAFMPAGSTGPPSGQAAIAAHLIKMGYEAAPFAAMIAGQGSIVGGVGDEEAAPATSVLGQTAEKLLPDEADAAAQVAGKQSEQAPAAVEQGAAGDEGAVTGTAAPTASETAPSPTAEILPKDDQGSTPAIAAQSLAQKQIENLKAARVGTATATEFGRPDIATQVPESLTMDESQSLRQNVESYYAQGSEPPQMAAHVAALAGTYQDEAKSLYTLNQDIRARAFNGDDVTADMEQLKNRWAALAENYSTLAGTRSDVGRSLQILDPLKPGNAHVAAVAHLAQEFSIEDNPGRLSDLLAGMDPTQYPRVARQMATDVNGFGRSLYNGLNEYYVNNLLSDTGRTASKIGVSNAVSGLLTIPTRAIESIIPGSGVAYGSPLARMQGMVDGFWHALDVAAESLKTGARVSQMEGGETPFAADVPKAISAESFGLGATDPDTGDFTSSGIGKGVDYLGSVMRLPLRGLTAVHQFGHAMATSMVGHDLAWNDAVDQARNEGLSGLEGYSRAQGVYHATLNDMSDEMRNAASRGADKITFANQLEGIAGDAQKVLQYPVLKQFMPFFKVAYNVKKMGADFTPGLGALTQAPDILYGSPAERSTALAKQAFGATMAIMLAHEYRQGNITDDGPPPGAARDALMASGWRPNSIKVGDHYISPPEPLAFPLSTVANYMALSGQLDDPTYFQKGIAAAQAVGRATANQSIVQGLVNLKQLWNSASAGDPKAFEKFGGETLSGLVPMSSLLKGIARAQDPTIRDPQTVSQQLESGIPGMQDDAPPRFDIYGKPVIGMPGVPNNLLYPVNVTTNAKLDKVDQAIVDTQAHFARTPSYISGRAQKGLDDPNNPDIGVPLSSAEQEQWAAMRGDGLKDQLEKLVDSPSFGSASKLMQKQLLEFVGAKYSEVATLRLLQADPTLMAKYIDRQRAKKMALTPPDAMTSDAGTEADAGGAP